MSATNAAIALLAFDKARQSTKRKPGRPPKRRFGTLLSGPGVRVYKTKPAQRGRPKGSVKYTDKNLAWLLERVELRKAEARAEGRALSDRAAIRLDMFEYYRSQKGDGVNAAKRNVARYAPKVQKVLSRYRKSLEK